MIVATSGVVVRDDVKKQSGGCNRRRPIVTKLLAKCDNVAVQKMFNQTVLMVHKNTRTPLNPRCVDDEMERSWVKSKVNCTGRICSEWRESKADGGMTV